MLALPRRYGSVVCPWSSLIGGYRRFHSPHLRVCTLAFEEAEKQLALAGLTLYTLFIPEVEDFVARKGQWSDPSSRPLECMINASCKENVK